MEQGCNYSSNFWGVPITQGDWSKNSLEVIQSLLIYYLEWRFYMSSNIFFIFFKIRMRAGINSNFLLTNNSRYLVKHKVSCKNKLEVPYSYLLYLFDVHMNPNQFSFQEVFLLRSYTTDLTINTLITIGFLIMFLQGL